MAKENQTPQRQDGYRLEVIEDEALLFHPGQSRMIYLNPSASLIWQLCDGQRTVEEITRLLTESYPDAGRDIAGDVESTLDALEEHGAIALD